MPMYNLLEYSENYSMALGSLWNYYRDDINDDENETDRLRNRLNSNKTIRSKSFEYKTKLTGSTSDNNYIINAEVVPLKYLSNFWRSLDLPLINCEIELDLTWSKYCVISQVSKTFRAVDPNADPVAYEVATETTAATFQTNNAKLYVHVVTLSINDNIKCLEKIKQAFKRTISWNKYRSEITTQPKDNNLDLVIGPTFRKINRLFVLSFRNGEDDPTRDFFDCYYISLVEIKDFHALIDNKQFFDQPVKYKQGAYEKLIEMTRNDKYATGNLLDYLYHQNYYKLIDIDLSRQKNRSIPQQIHFTRKLEKDDGAVMIFIAGKLQETILNFSLNSLIVSE